MGSRPERPSLGRRFASWSGRWLASQALGAVMLAGLVALGLGYTADDDRLDEATVSAANQLGSDSFADGYQTFSKRILEIRKRVVEHVPDFVKDRTRQEMLLILTPLVVLGTVVLLVRAPSRAHALEDLGQAIAQPGLLAGAATVVLEWSALEAVRERVSAGDAEDVPRHAWMSLTVAGYELGYPLMGAVVLVAAGLLLRPRKDDRAKLPLGTRYMVARFLFLLGLVPLGHLVLAVVLGTATRGARVGAMCAPWIRGPLTYGACAALFALGLALWLGGRAERKRVEKEEAAKAK